MKYLLSVIAFVAMALPAHAQSIGIGNTYDPARDEIGIARDGTFEGYVTTGSYDAFWASQAELDAFIATLDSSAFVPDGDTDPMNEFGVFDEATASYTAVAGQAPQSLDWLLSPTPVDSNGDPLPVVDGEITMVTCTDVQGVNVGTGESIVSDNSGCVTDFHALISEHDKDLSNDPFSIKLVGEDLVGDLRAGLQTDKATNTAEANGTSYLCHKNNGDEVRSLSGLNWRQSCGLFGHVAMWGLTAVPATLPNCVTVALPVATVNTNYTTQLTIVTNPVTPIPPGNTGVFLGGRSTTDITICANSDGRNNTPHSVSVYWHVINGNMA